MSFWRYFPQLQRSNCRVTSASTRVYNCVAWAAGRTDAWWWPGPEGVTFWPDGVDRVVALQAFQEVFQQLGYALGSDRSAEADVEKVAIFALNGIPTHVARQLPDGLWTSKLGPSEDIEHPLEGLEGPVYGSIVAILSRSRS